MFLPKQPKSDAQITQLVAATRTNPATGAPVPAEEEAFLTDRIGTISVKAFGAVGNNTNANTGADDTAAVQAALDAAFDAGGGIVFLPNGRYKISGPLTVRLRVSIVGLGFWNAGTSGTQIDCTTADSGLRFEETSGAMSGGFTVHGRNVATTCIDIGFGGFRTYSNIQAINAVQDNVVIRQSQNSFFHNLVTQYAGRDNLRLDDGAGGLRFYGFQSEVAGRYGIYVTQTNVIPGYTRPTHIRFDHALLETNANDSLIHIHKGDDITFTTPRIAASGATPAWPLVQLADASASIVRIEDATFLGAATQDAVAVGSNGFLYLGGLISGVGVRAVVGVGAGQVYDDAVYRFAGGTVFINPAAPSDGNAVVSNPRQVALQVTRRSGGLYAFRSTVQGEAGVRFQFAANGTLEFGDGTSFTTFDTNLKRAGANVLKTDDKFLAALGLGVGNSVAATTPGAVTRKIEVFDANGASIGFIAVYGSIT